MAMTTSSGPTEVEMDIVYFLGGWYWWCLSYWFCLFVFLIFCFVLLLRTWEELRESKSKTMIKIQCMEETSKKNKAYKFILGGVGDI